MSTPAKNIPTPQSPIDIMEELLIESTIELFKEYGMIVTVAGSTAPIMPSHEEHMAGVIGFSHENIRGAITLLMNNRLVSETRPEELKSSTSPTAEQDWMAELSNQQLGRMKNKMLCYGVTLGMSTPTALSGNKMILSPPRSRDARWVHLHTPEGPAYVLFDSEVESDFELQKNGSAEDISSEGDLLLF